MSLQVNVNIVKGWPSATAVEKNLPAAAAVAQGDIVYISSTGQWEKTAASVAKEAFIVLVDSTDPATGRVSTNPSSYSQVAYGSVQALSLSNPLEIETTRYTGSSFAPNTELTLDGTTGALKAAVATNVVIGRCTTGFVQIGDRKYITFMPCASYVKA
jgi:hypothetical protein